MNGEIYQISLSQFYVMMDTCSDEDRENIHKAAELSTEIIVGIFGNQPVCFIGLAPRTLMSDTAYAWMMVTNYGKSHTLLLARYGRGFVAVMLAKYCRIVGHCFDPRSVKWLKSLGAKFVSEIEFEFRRD